MSIQQKKSRKNVKMVTILSFMTVAIVLLIVIVSGALVWRHTHSIALEDFTASYEQFFAQADSQVEDSMQRIANMASALNADPELIGAVNRAVNTQDIATQLENTRYAEYLLKNAVGYQPYIDNVGIYVKDISIVMNNLSSADYLERLPSEPWFAEIREQQSSSHLISNYPLRRHVTIGGDVPHYSREYTIYATAFNDSLIAKNTGVLLVSVEQAYLDSFFGQTDYSDGRKILLLQEGGSPIYTSEPVGDSFLKQFTEQKDAPSRSMVALEQEEYYFFSKTNQFTGWEMVALVPAATLQHLVRSMMSPLLLGILIVGFLGILLCIALSKSITDPVESLIASMDQAGRGNLQQTHEESYIHEMNQLISRYDRMLAEITFLIEQMRTVEEEKRNAEMLALQSQINPHFIYNTLNSIQWVAKMQQESKIDQMLGLFSRLLRLSTQQNQGMIPVAQELEQIRCFIEIMQFRYNSDIETQFQVEPEVEPYMTLPLLLQPLVENAFIHGFEGLKRSGTLHILAYQRDDILYFVVEDDGVGMELAAGQLPRTQQENYLHSQGIGIANTHRRLQLWFGREHGLYYESQPDVGTRVTLTQPLLFEPPSSYPASAPKEQTQ